MWIGPEHRHRSASPLARIRNFAARTPAREQCELCSAGLAEDHEHLLEPLARQILCACTPCAILFSHRGGAKYRRIPRRVVDLSALRLTDVQWQAFGLPVALAFFHRGSRTNRVSAVYPSPAGATEAQLPPDIWEEFLAEHPALTDLEPDVEALLVNRVGASRDMFRVGIDLCYRLAGILRLHWKGFSGGGTVWEEIGRFFEQLKRRSGTTENVNA